ncbi:hypothetical protein D3C84_1147490 [compost metagenome]
MFFIVRSPISPENTSAAPMNTNNGRNIVVNNPNMTMGKSFAAIAPMPIPFWNLESKTPARMGNSKVTARKKMVFFL